jgi:hypothetical protein
MTDQEWQDLYEKSLEALCKGIDTILEIKETENENE